MNSLGDKRSSKILFGKRKKLPAAIFTHTKTSFQIIRENILLSEKQKEKVLRKNSLYYTEKNFRFVRVFFKIFYTLFTFNFSKEKIPLYNTEKNSSFVDVFWKKIYKLFYAKRGSPKNVGQTSFYIVYPSKTQK